MPARTGRPKLRLLLLILSLCCRTLAMRLSERKCREYGALVQRRQAPPVLSLRHGMVSENECPVVGVPLVVGGTKAAHREFPHMVEIGYGEPIRWKCGGSLISESFVLTAAHCLPVKKSKLQLHVLAGTTNLERPGPEAQTRPVAEVIPYPGYKYPRHYHDIGLLRVEPAFRLSPAVRPACLETGDLDLGAKAVATGFGQLSIDQRRNSEHLMKVELDHRPVSDCHRYKEYLGRSQLSHGVDDTMLCVGVMAGGKDTCYGDSGGPLQRTLQDPYCMYSIVGVTSFGMFCAFADSPAIYVKVSAYVDWIESTVWPDEYKGPDPLTISSAA